MRKAGTTSSERNLVWLKGAVRLSAAALGIGLLIAAGAARAQDDEDEDKTFEEKIIDGIMKGMGATNMDNTGIDYRERSPLVVPRNLDLPPPASDAAAANVPNWPKDPDEARHKAYAAARKKEGRKEAGQAARDAARPLSPSELNAAKTASTGRGTHDSDTERPGSAPSAPLSPSQLGFDGKLSSYFGGSKSEQKEFKAEPTRDSLTQPPPGYQTPSPSYAYGTGPKESLNKEYNPSAGKYGD
ncbi:MAG: hypothetical protein JOY90_39165 [Bradyrhizobium sp.]|uniref:hypothetical protein n=1 Tax=Bradyrhizobium sp. TaxID=376 RepID=UPI001D878425|nr:hypothetical protein [Bradyrhizobium sp.]MBV9566423.1 hypothetical protein [Bradyrhizobium sp.]